MDEISVTRVLADQYPVVAVLLLQLIVAVRYLLPLIGQAVSAIVDFKVELACLRGEVRDLRESWQNLAALFADGRQTE